MKRRERPIPDYKARRLAAEFERQVAERIAAQVLADIETAKAMLAGGYYGSPLVVGPQVH
jgi:hypothetical protein